jgi:hypothetical protein
VGYAGILGWIWGYEMEEYSNEGAVALGILLVIGNCIHIFEDDIIMVEYWSYVIELWHPRVFFYDVRTENRSKHNPSNNALA